MSPAPVAGDDFAALVLLPGALLAPSEELLRRLGASRRVIAVTYPDATRMTDLTDAIAGQLAAASIERAAVLGSSYGGWVAQCLARRHSALVRRLLLVHTFALRQDAARRFRIALKIWQALPGPLFTFAAFLGSALNTPPDNLAGAALALVAIFLPGLLILLGALPFWDEFRKRMGAQAMMRGVNAAVVGILGAALYNPLWTTAILAPRDFALALAGFLALTLWKAPARTVVAGTVAAAIALQSIG